jgi:hypothetical protein
MTTDHSDLPEVSTAPAGATTVEDVLEAGPTKG